MSVGFKVGMMSRVELGGQVGKDEAGTDYHEVLNGQDGMHLHLNVG